MVSASRSLARTSGECTNVHDALHSCMIDTAVETLAVCITCSSLVIVSSGQSNSLCSG